MVLICYSFPLALFLFFIFLKENLIFESGGTGLVKGIIGHELHINKSFFKDGSEKRGGDGMEGSEERVGYPQKEGRPV